MTGLYIHIPFCIQKCRYCDFNSVPVNCETDLYVNALINELQNGAKQIKDKIDTVFIGGGTPSVLSLSNTEKILKTVFDCFDIAENAEITTECNPGTVTLGMLKKYREYGINRLSMGVQSLNNDELKTIGRIHSVKEVLEAYASAKIAGFENINYDIMFGLPYQNLKKFMYSIENIIKLEPKHISCYSLQIEEGTYLFEHQNEYRFPDDEENRKMYHGAIDFLKDNGFYQYELSNFAKNGFESRHNLKYWEMESYLGFGLGASSFYNGARFKNPDSFKEYYDFVPDYKKYQSETKKDLMSEFMFLGLRKTKGISDADFKKLFGVSFFDEYKEAINKHIKNGLLEEDDCCIKLTVKGMDLANTVMSDFV